MLKSLYGFDWKNSSAHLLFLSKFQSLRAESDFIDSYIWKEVLGESPSQAIIRFKNEDMLKEANLNSVLDFKYKVSDLKPMLRHRGLKVSGRKAELIKRLIQADPIGMRDIANELILLQCTENGKRFVEEYIVREKEKRDKAEKNVFQALRQHKFKEASQIVAAFESQQVFPRGIGIDWKQYDSALDVKILKIISKATPSILSSLNDEQIDKVRIVAGMMHLWGTNNAKDWLPSDFETQTTMDEHAVVRMMNFYATHQVDIAEYRDMGVKRVKMTSVNDSHICKSCQELFKRDYKLSQVPELPYKNCTSEMGCRCGITVSEW